MQTQLTTAFLNDLVREFNRLRIKRNLPALLRDPGYRVDDRLRVSFSDPRIEVTSIHCFMLQDRAGQPIPEHLDPVAIMEQMFLDAEEDAETWEEDDDGNLLPPLTPFELREEVTHIGVAYAVFMDRQQVVVTLGILDPAKAADHDPRRRVMIPRKRLTQVALPSLNEELPPDGNIPPRRGPVRKKRVE